MSSTLFTNLGNPVDASWLNQVDTASFSWLSGIGGTSNAITATGPVTLTAYAAGQVFRFLPVLGSTAAVTLNINGLGAKAIILGSGSPLTTGDLAIGVVVEVVYDGTNFQMQSVPGVGYPLPIAKGGTGQITAPLARAALGAAASGANNDITSLSGLTTPLSIAQGGTNSTTAAAALIALGAIGRLLNVVRLTGSGNYAPTAGTTSILAFYLGAGAAGGGSQITAAGELSAGGGGGGGAQAIHRATSGFSGSPYVIGVGGVGASGAVGGNGTATTFLGVSAAGGQGGLVQVTSPNAGVGSAGAGGLSTGANILNGAGVLGGVAIIFAAALAGLSGAGASTLYGAGGIGVVGNLPGQPATGFGSGGGGAFTLASSAAQAGGNGAPGTLLIYEFA